MKTKKLILLAAITCLLFGLWGGATTTADARGGSKRAILEYLMETDGAQALVAVVEFVDDSNGSGECAGIADTLGDKKAKDVVVFAPSNPAFERFFRRASGEFDGLDIDAIKSKLPEFLDKIESSTDDLCEVLLNHVAGGEKKSPKTVQELLESGQITVAEGSVFPISVGSGDVAVNYESEISQGDVTVKNGIIHFVKSVIRNEPPPSDEAITVFVTQPAYQGDLGGLAGADALCQQRAQATGLPGTDWTAWLSDNTASAIDRIPDGEYRLVDGKLVADNKTDLIDGSLKAPINLNEYGVVQSGIVWTATTLDGIGTGNTCNNWTDASSESGGCPDPGDPNCGSVGSTAATNAEWTKLNAAPFQCNAQYNLYCFGGGE